VRPAPGQTRFTVPLMAASWAGCYLLANLIAALAVALTGYGDTVQERQPIWVLVLAATALWVPFMVMLEVLSTRVGTGRWRDDYRLQMRPVDLVGLPIGVLSQLVLVNLVVWPFRTLFPDTFTSERIEERARDLYERAEGVWLLALVLVVVVGAPFVEEVIYRGFIQGTLRSRIDDMLALVVTAVWFTVIHLRPIEFPGLLAFALVLGACFHLTNRLGMPILAHVAFNATGLALVAWG
jgi:uncharacterized protein